MTGGTLTAGTEVINGNGVFMQSAGVRYRFVARDQCRRELCPVRGKISSSLSVGGTFTQSGGTDSAFTLTIGSGGDYVLSGGTLSVTTLVDNGILDFANAPVSFSGGPSTLIDFSGGQLIHTSNASVTGNASSIMIFPAGFNPATQFKSFSNPGITGFAGSTITIPAGKLFSIIGSILNRVVVQGTLSTATLMGGVNVTGSGSLSFGSAHIDNATSGMDGGTITAETLYIGDAADGTFTQTGGSNGATTIYLGNKVGSHGTYNLSGGTMGSATSVYVGYNGSGVVNQTGGTASLGFVYIGYSAGATGIYTYGGGSFAPLSLNVGYRGNGTFVQTLGTVGTAGQGTLEVGEFGGSTGIYDFRGGQANSSFAFIGDSGNGTFINSGGTHTVTNLYVGYQAGSTGTYSLAGGTLNSTTAYVGYSGTGTMTQSSGTTATIGTLNIGYLSNGAVGTYNLNGGALNASSVHIGSGGTGTMNQSGGTVTVAGLFGLGELTSGTGSYNLSGGTLTAATEVVGASSTSTTAGSSNFTQTGGTNSTGVLTVSRLGKYSLQGGSLNVTQNFVLSGEIDFQGGAANLPVNNIADFSTSRFDNVSQVSISAAPGTLVIFPDAQVAGRLASYSNTAGITHVAGTRLAVDATASYSWSGTINDPVDVAGTLRGTSLTLTNGVTVSGSGAATLGAVTINDMASGISGGILSASASLGSSANAVFTQSGGTFTGTATIGASPNFSSTYFLTGGTHTGSLNIGSAGPGARSGNPAGTQSESVTIGAHRAFCNTPAGAFRRPLCWTPASWIWATPRSRSR